MPMARGTSGSVVELEQRCKTVATLRQKDILFKGFLKGFLSFFMFFEGLLFFCLGCLKGFLSPLKAFLRVSYTCLLWHPQGFLRTLVAGLFLR